MSKQNTFTIPESRKVKKTAENNTQKANAFKVPESRKQTTTEKAPVKTVLEKANPEIKRGVIDLTKSPVDEKKVIENKIKKAEEKVQGAASGIRRASSSDIENINKLKADVSALKDEYERKYNSVEYFDRKAHQPGQSEARQADKIVAQYLPYLDTLNKNAKYYLENKNANFKTSDGTIKTGAELYNETMAEYDKVNSAVVDMQKTRDYYKNLTPNQQQALLRQKQNAQRAKNVKENEIAETEKVKNITAKYGFDFNSFSYGDFYDWAIKHGYTETSEGRIVPKFGKNGPTQQEKEEFDLLNWYAVNKRYNELSQGTKLQKAFASFESIGANIVGGLGQMPQLLKSSVTGQDIDLTSNAARHSLLGANIRENVTKDMSGKGAFLYQTGMSIADNLALLPMATIPGVGEGLVLGTMGSIAAAQKANQLTLQGHSGVVAAQMGLIAGAIEVVTEKIGLDNLMDLATKKAGKSVLIGMLKQVGAEGMEEGLSDILNFAFDQIAYGDNSEYNQKVRAYENGDMTGKKMSREEARKLAFADFATDLGISVAGGALSGLVFGLGGGAINTGMTAYKGSQIINQGNTNSLISQALNTPQNMQSNVMAQRMAQEITEGKKPSALKTGRLLGQFEAEGNTFVTSDEEAKSKKERTIVLTENNDLKRRISGLKGAQKYKEIKNYILGVLSEQPIVLSDKTEAIVDKRDAAHIAHDAADKKTAIISEIKKAVEKATLYATDEKVEHRKFNSFRYYEAFVEYGDETVPIYLNVGKGIVDNKYHIYDITQKIRETAHRINGVERVKDLRSENSFSTNTTISQDKSGVNSNFMQKDGKYSNTLLFNFAKSYGGNGKNIFTRFYIDSQDAAEYAREMNNAYTAGKTGEAMPSFRTISREQAAAMYQAGQVDTQNTVGIIQNNTSERFKVDNPKIYNTLNGLGKRLKTKIVIDENIEGADGYFNPTSGELHINRNAQNPVNVLMKHEFTHVAKGTKQYNELINYMKDNFSYEWAQKEREIIDFYERVNRSRELKGQEVITLDAESLSDEVMAEFSEQFDSDAFLERIAQENPSMLTKIRDFIRDIIDRLKNVFSDSELKRWQKAERMWENAIKNADATNRTGDVEYSFAGKDEAIQKYNAQIDSWLKGELNSNDVFELGATPVVLKSLNVPNLPIVMSQDVMTKITGGKHNISLDEIRNIPNAIADPIMVFKSATVDNALVMLTELTDKNGDSVIVAMHLSKYINRIKVNNIASVYGKQGVDNFVSGQIRNGNLKYLDNKKGQVWATSRGLQLPKLVQSNPDNNIVLQKDDIVNTYSMQNSKNDAKEYKLQEPVDVETENTELKAQLEDVQKRLSEAQARADRAEAHMRPQVLEKDIQSLAGKLIKEYGSDLKKSDIADDLRDLGNYILRMGDGNDVYSFDNLKYRANKIADMIVEYTKEETPFAQTYKQIKSYFKDTKITVTQKGDFADYESFRKSMFGKMRLVNEGGTAIDTLWAELGEMYGENLFPIEITAESDMIQHIADFLTDMDDVYYNPYDQNRGEMREIIANGIISELTDNVRTVALGDALELNEKLIAEKKRTAEIMRLKTEIKNTEAALAAEWERFYEEKAKQLKEQQKFKDKKQAQEERAERQRLLKIAKTLTSKRFYDSATEATRTEIDELIGDLDTAAVGILNSTKDRLSEWGDRYREIAATNPDFIPDPQIENELRRIGQKRIADMDIDDVRNLTDALITIEHEMHTANRLLAETERAEIKENGLRIISDIMATKGRKGEKGNSFMSASLSPERMINRVIGYKKNSPLVKSYRNLQNGTVKMFDFQMEANRRFERYTSDKKFIDSIKGKSARAITITGTTEGGRGNVKITPAMLMSLYMHSQNFQNLRHIAKGGLVVPDYELIKKGKTAEAIRNSTTIHMTRSEINMAVRNLTAKERDFCYAMTEYFKWSGGRINEVSNILVGHDIARVGNYFPIASDKNFLDTDFTIMNDDGSLSSMGFLKERKNATNPIYLFGADDVVTRSIENQSRYIGLAIPVRDMNKLLNVADIRAQEINDTDDKFDKAMAYGTREVFFTESVKSAIVKRWGDTTYSYIEKMMHDVQGMNNQLSESEQTFAKLKSHAAAVALGMNIGVALKQHPSYFAAAVELDFESLAKGYIMPVNKKLLGKSSLYWYRELGYNNTELAEIRKQGIKFPKWANPIQAMDLFTVRKLLSATEAYIKKTEPSLKGEEYEKAVLDKFHDVIRRTQPNYTTLERNGISRDRSAMAQILSFFKTQPFQNLNILLDAQGELNAQENRFKNLTRDDAEYERAKKDFETARNRNTRAVISQVISGALFATLGFVVDALKHKTKGYRDDDDELTVESVLKKLGINFMGNTVGMMPTGSEIWGATTYTIDKLFKSAGKNKIFDATSYGVSSPQIEFINDVANDVSKLLVELEKGIIDISNGDDVEWEKLARISFNALGQLAAFKDLPFNNIKNDLFMIAKNAIYAVKGKEEGKYWDLRLEYEPQGNKKEYYDLLYKAQGTKAYETIKKRLIENDGFTEKGIEDAMTDRYLEKETNYKADVDKILQAGEKTEYYANLSDEGQKDFEKKVTQYAKGVALKNKKEPDKWITVAEKLSKSSDIPVEKFIEIYTECSAIESDKDANGKTINNSRGIKRKNYIDSQVKSSVARKALYDLLQVGKEAQSGGTKINLLGSSSKSQKQTINLLN